MFTCNRLLVIIISLNTHLFAEATLDHATIENMTDVSSASTSVEHTSLPSSSLDQYLARSSIIFGLSRIANETNLSEQCFKDFKSIEKGILKREPWAMKVLDASGAKGSGFIWGQNYWLGSQAGCAAVQNPVRITFSKQFKRKMKEELLQQIAPFQMDYRVVYLEHNSPWQVELKLTFERIIHIGLCLPVSCSSTDFLTITQTFIDEGLLEDSKIYELDLKVLYTKDLKLKSSFFERGSLKILIGFTLFTVLMIIAGTFLLPDNPEKNDVSEGHSAYEYKGVVNFVKCFDLIANARALFKTQDLTANSVSVIDGLKSLACLWVSIAHVICFMYFAFDNKAIFGVYGEMTLYQFISAGTVLVDLFFTISGFMHVYHFLRNETYLQIMRDNTLMQNGKIFAQMLFHRYLRLTPLYLVVTAMVDLFTSYAVDVSIFHIQERYDQTCPKYWWRNAFYIQNLFDHRDLCVNWSWYLACDMQFFCVVSLLLFTYVKQPNLVKALVPFTLVATTLWTYVVNFRTQFQLSIDMLFHNAVETYTNPFLRATPYLLGAIAGWCLSQKKGKIKMNPRLEKYLWNLAILVFFSCTIYPIKRDLSVFMTTSLVVAGRLGVSLAVCWIILASAGGRGTWWSRMLQNRHFRQLSRLSYATYLLNPLVIISVASLSRTSYHIDPLQLSVFVFGFMAIVYVVTIVFSLAFEIPYHNWSKLMLKRKLKAA